MDLWDEKPSLPKHREWQQWLDWQQYRDDTYPRLAEEPIPTSITAEHAKTESALRFMEQQQDHERPFFLWLSYLYPHTPYEAPEPFFSMYSQLPDPQVEAGGLASAGKPFRQQYHQRNNDAIIPFTSRTSRPDAAGILRHDQHD